MDQDSDGQPGEPVEDRFTGVFEIIPRTFVFFFTGFCSTADESGLQSLSQKIASDLTLSTVGVIVVPVLGWSGGVVCQFTPGRVRIQMRAASNLLRNFLRGAQATAQDRVVLIGHSYGGNIAYSLAGDVRSDLRGQQPAYGIVTFDPIDWEHCGLRGTDNLHQHCDQSDGVHMRPLPRVVSPSNVLNFVQRNPSTPFPFLHGYVISGARNDESIGRGPDTIWGTLDDTNHNLIDDDRSPGADRLPGNEDDRELGIHEAVLDYLRRQAMINSVH